jgi:uncharacterized membrane protein YjgN (DUF898 family)
MPYLQRVEGVTVEHASGIRPAEPLRFTGNGAEYFGIWIVNLLLTLATLGIYSAWAKVRRLQYFYRHTELAGSSFDFHGSPIRILVGRIAALALFILYNFSVRLHSPLTLAVLLGLAIVMPWLLRNSFRFRLYNSSWRGTRFHFTGSTGGAYRVFLLNGFLALITLYAMAPFMHQRFKAYQHDNSWLGRTRFSFHATAGGFYLLYLMLVAALAVFGYVLVKAGIGSVFMTLIQSAQKTHGRVDPHALFKAIAIVYGALILAGLVIGPAFQALMTNLIWNNTRIGEHRIACNLSPCGLMWLSASNFVLIVVTLGLFIPWAAVRSARFHLEAAKLLPATDLQEFVAGDSENIGAVGAEAATVFDFDISL